MVEEVVRSESIPIPEHVCFHERAHQVNPNVLTGTLVQAQVLLPRDGVQRLALSTAQASVVQRRFPLLASECQT